MKRFLLLALTAGLLSPLNGKTESLWRSFGTNSRSYADVKETTYQIDIRSIYDRKGWSYVNRRNILHLFDYSQTYSPIWTIKVNCSEGIIDNGIYGESSFQYKVGNQWWNEVNKSEGYRGFVHPEIEKITGSTHKSKDSQLNQLYNDVCGG